MAGAFVPRLTVSARSVAALRQDLTDELGRDMQLLDGHKVLEVRLPDVSKRVATSSDYLSCGIEEDGDLWCWGRDARAPDPVQIALPMKAAVD